MGGVSIAADQKPPAKTENAATALQKLKAQCDDSQTSQGLAWPGYLSETEMARNQAIQSLKAEENSSEMVRGELKTANGEYRQMLTIALVALERPICCRASRQFDVEIRNSCCSHPGHSGVTKTWG